MGVDRRACRRGVQIYMQVLEGLRLLFGCQLDLLNLLRKPSVGLVYTNVDAAVIWWSLW